MCTTPNAVFQPSPGAPLKFLGPARYPDSEPPQWVLDKIHFSKVFPLDCGKCLDCRIWNSKQKAIRYSHEARFYKESSFITLTYAPEFLPSDESIVPDHARSFVKNLRKRICKLDNCYGRRFNWALLRYMKPGCRGFCRKIKTFGCAEYGKKGTVRPHYHICILGFQFPDLTGRRLGKNDFSTKRWPIYTSKICSSIWKKGFIEIGTVTEDSAAYVASYVTKKIGGKAAAAHYGDRLPERSVCVSNRPGIGKVWLDQYFDSLFRLGFVSFKGKKERIPRYYLKHLKLISPDRYETLIEKLKPKTIEFEQRRSPSRMRARNEILKAQAALRKASYELS